MPVLNRFLLIRHLLETAVGGLSLYLVMLIFWDPMIEGGRFLMAFVIVVVFPFSSLYVVSSLIFEKWNYSGNKRQRSVIKALIFALHFIALSVPIRLFGHFLWPQALLGAWGSIVVYYLNLKIRPDEHWIRNTFTRE